jgi:beta-glucanase (GH16 family)
MSRSIRTLKAAVAAIGLPMASRARAADGKSLVFSEEFNSAIDYGSKWTGDRSAIFWGSSHKSDWVALDWLTTDAVTVANGVATFTATPSGNSLEDGKQAWNTGMLTTEYTAQDFHVKTGDYAETRVQLPTRDGAWPALFAWTGNDDEVIRANNEIDSFEYHPDAPNTLEFTNHVNDATKVHTDAGAIAPGKWIIVGTYYGADSVSWYVNGQKVYSDGTGVGADWTANLLLNMHVSDGTYHPAPSDSTPITYSADYVRVYR